MYYTVRYGDSLAGIADRFYGSPDRWTIIADENRISPVVELLVGQVLFLPGAPNVAAADRFCSIGQGNYLSFANQPATDVPGRVVLFVLADEFDFLSRTAVRRVAVSLGSSEAEVLQRVTQAKMPDSPVSIGRHVMGQNNSKYISASERLLGTPRLDGKRFWIDLDKVKASGSRIIEADEIASDLDRIALKERNSLETLLRVDRSRLQTAFDREILIEGEIPLGAVKSGAARAASYGLQFLTGVAIIVSAYDLGLAARESIEHRSIRPLANESLRQASGWGGALAGARIGAMTGAAVSVETGPGAAIGAAIGGALGGIAGYFGASWVEKLEQ
jgi:hypothetical protein